MLPSQEEMLEALKKKQGKEAVDKFSSATVAVCGLGGLGSNIAITLARAGVGKLILIDFDRIDITNLHRQQYKANQVGRYKSEALTENIQEIAPYIKIFPHIKKIDENNVVELLHEADVVCEAFDNAESKALLANVLFEKLPEKYLITASGIAGFGSSNEIKTRKITERFYLCGDSVSDALKLELLPSRVMLCASHQAHMALKILAQKLD